MFFITDVSDVLIIDLFGIFHNFIKLWFNNSMTIKVIKTQLVVLYTGWHFANEINTIYSRSPRFLYP